MRNTLRILLVLLVAIMVTCIFVACGKITTGSDTPPDVVGGGGNSSVDPTSGTPAYLTFSYLKQAPSVFKHIYIEDFDIGDIEYHVTYKCTVDGKTQYVADDGEPVTMDMLSKDSKKIIETFGDDEISGHYMIFVSKEVEYTDEYGDSVTKTVEGSFALHLKTRASALEFVDVTFELNGGYAMFGNYDANNNKVTVKVEKGQSWSWQEFISDYPIFKSGFALQDLSVGNKTYNASSADAITINEKTTFTVGWTESRIPVTFNINLPEGVSNWAPVDSNLLTNFNSSKGTWSVEVARGEGFIPRPNVGNIATLDGYTFAGWKTADGKVWNFNKRAGNEPVELYALWTIRTFSVTYIFMGGEFNSDKGYADAAITGLTKSEIDVDYALGYAPGDPNYDPSSTRDDLAFKPFIVTFSGLTYGSSLSDFYAECLVKSNGEDTIKVSPDPTILQTQITKSDGCYEVSGWYYDMGYDEDSAFEDAPVTTDLVLYPKWTLKKDLGAQELNEYFTKKLYVYSEKSDGTLRIDKVLDMSVTELVVPASVYMGNKLYYITEVGEGAIMNIKTLMTLDLSGATSLQRIEKNAFAYCPNLKEVILPEEGLNISYVGENAFSGTEFINSYSQTHGTDFAVIGNVLIEYTGDPTVKSIDIDTASAVLANVDTIAPGAFDELASLESVAIGDGIKFIYDKAFSRCTNLTTVTGGNGLEYVASTAFDQTAFLTTQPADNSETTIDESQYIRIGSVYYRFVGTGTNAAIPEGVKVIAPDAFSAGHRIEVITFEDASQIVTIGADAFDKTKWIDFDHTPAETGHETTYIQNGFVVINGILIAKRGRDAKVELPASITTIATGAFDNTHVTNITVPADSNLKTIEANAFAGASNLRALSFISNTDSVFAEIQDGAFNGSTGGAINDEFKIYLYDAPMATIKSASSASDSTAIKAWKNLYKTAANMFETFYTLSTRFNDELDLPLNYLFDGANVDFVAVWDSLGILNAEKTHLVDGAIVVRNDGVESMEDLAISEIMALVDGTTATLEGTTGTNKAMVFEVDGVQSTPYVYNVYPSILVSSMAVYHEVDGVDILGLPTFYTTQSNFNQEGHVIKIKFTYNDGNNTPGEMLLTDELISVEGYTPVQGSGKALYVYVDYYGLATYTINASYNVKRPSDIAVEQTTSMTVSVNAPQTEINSVAGKVILKVTSNDGTFKYVNIGTKSTFISVADAQNKVASAEEVALETSTIGYHTVGLRYGEPGKYVYTTILYSVILNTDGSLFTYEIKGETATITGVRASYDSTVAIPTRVKLNESGAYNPDSTTEYVVTAIADRAFKDKTHLEYIYIPSTVTTIGNEAFMGCTSLKQVRSFTVAEQIDCGLTTDVVTVTEQQAVLNGEVTINSLVDSKKSTVTIPATLSYTKVVEGGGDDGCDLEVTYNLDVKLGNNVFITYNGTVALPDTEYFRTYALDHLYGKSVTFYTEGEADKASAFVFENYDNPTVLGGHKTGTVSINTNAILVVTDGVLVVPESISGEVQAEISPYPYTYEYVVTGVQEGAFATAFAEGGLSVIYLPNSLVKCQGDLEELFGAGNYSSVTQHVYDVSEVEIYAPNFAFPQNITSIGNKAFYGCTMLGYDGSGTVGYDKDAYAPYAIDFSLATALNQLGSYAFYGCTSIKAIDLSATALTSIEASMFSGCTSLYTVALPVATMKEIGDLAFDGCVNLTEVSGTSGLTYIGSFAFHNCTSLTSFVLGEGLRFDVPTTPGNEATVSGDAFDGCTALTSLVVLTADAKVWDDPADYTGVSICVLYTLLPQLTEVKVGATLCENGDPTFLGSFTKGATSTYTDQTVEYEVITFTK